MLCYPDSQDEREVGRHQTRLMSMIKEELTKATSQNITYCDLKQTHPNDLESLISLVTDRSMCGCHHCLLHCMSLILTCDMSVIIVTPVVNRVIIHCTYARPSDSSKAVNHLWRGIMYSMASVQLFVMLRVTSES